MVTVVCSYKEWGQRVGPPLSPPSPPGPGMSPLCSRTSGAGVQGSSGEKLLVKVLGKGTGMAGGCAQWESSSHQSTHQMPVPERDPLPNRALLGQSGEIALQPGPGSPGCCCDCKAVLRQLLQIWAGTGPGEVLGAGAGRRQGWQGDWGLLSGIRRGHIRKAEKCWEDYMLLSHQGPWRPSC